MERQTSTKSEGVWCLSSETVHSMELVVVLSTSLPTMKTRLKSTMSKQDSTGKRETVFILGVTGSLFDKEFGVTQGLTTVHSPS